MQALIAIENNVTVSTDYEIFLFAGVVILYITREGGPTILFCLCHDKR